MTLKGQLGRFFTGSVAGAVLDFAVAAALVGFGVSLLVACIAGLVCAVALTYWVHLRWTFKLQEARFLSPYLLRFAASSLLTLGVRMLIIETGSALFTQLARWQELLVLGTAIGCSFCINFLLSALWAFSQRNTIMPTEGLMKDSMRNFINSRYIDIITGCVVAGVIVFTTLGQITTGAHWIDDHHSGNILYGALSLLKGGALFSDVQSIYGLTVPTLFAGSLYVFGEHYLSLFFLPVICYIGGYVAFYFIFTNFLNRFLAMLSVLLMLASHSFVMLPWPNYIVFGLHALAIYLFICSIKSKITLTKYTYTSLCGFLVVLASTIRSQSILLLLIVGVAIILCYEKRTIIHMMIAMVIGAAIFALPFVAYLGINGTLYDYYAQTVALSKHLYFEKNSLWTVITHGILSVFTVGYHSAPLTLPKLPLGLKVFGNLNGLYWGMLFCVALFVSGAIALTLFRKKIAPQQDNAAYTFSLQHVALFLIASLTVMGPLFSLHNIWDNFRYNLHMSQGMALLVFAAFSLKNLQPASTACLGLISCVILSYSAQVFPLFYTTSLASFKQVQTLMKEPLANADLKYFESISIKNDFYKQLQAFNRFIDSYVNNFSGYHFYPDHTRITTSLYTIGTSIPYSKMLTNRHYHSVQHLVYPEFPNVYASALKERKLIFITTKNASQLKHLHNYSRVDIYPKTGLCLLMPSEIVPADIPESQVQPLAKLEAADVQEHSAFNLTDANWTKGVHKREAAFFVSNTPKNQSTYHSGATLKFANGETRNILCTQPGSTYLNIYVSGAPLDGNKVGHPFKIDVIK